MSLAGCQINQIDVNFHLQKSLEIFDQIQLTKSEEKARGWKVPSLMPIRVKAEFIFDCLLKKLTPQVN